MEMTMITIERETLQQLHDEMETVEYDADPPRRVLALMEKLRAALAAQPAEAQQEPVVYTYVSTQATMCAGCGAHKHTPLRIDAMGGYVCLTCIDRKLGSLLGEFGYPDPPAPAVVPPFSNAQLDRLYANSPAQHKDATSAAAFKRIVKLAESAHGIGAKGN